MPNNNVDHPPTNTIELLDINLPQPAGYSPVRQPLSIRRTSNIDITWPHGREQAMQLKGTGRDLFTAARLDNTQVINLDQLNATIANDRTITSIEATPSRPTIKHLLGTRGGGHLRAALNESLPEEKKLGSPLYLLLDDISGVSLISPWAWSRWPQYVKQGSGAIKKINDMRLKMENVCIGFKTGSSSLTPKYDIMQSEKNAYVKNLANPQDPLGWHTLPEYSDVSMRRARRIDCWIDGDIKISASFQDSASTPSGQRAAVHEYTLSASINPDSLRINTLSAQPHILPAAECPSAILGLAQFKGECVSELRFRVLELLTKTKGCTHLNDAVRALAEVPQLLTALQQQIKLTN